MTGASLVPTVYEEERSARRAWQAEVFAVGAAVTLPR